MEKLFRDFLPTVLVLCLATAVPLRADGNEPGSPADRKQPTPLEQAVEEFRLETRNLGIRPDSPVTAANSAGPKMLWHGRLFENFRNDALDAVPHEIRQLGGSKGLLRRNQFGFNVGGPVVIPHLFNGKNTTFFSLSYEGVRERIARTTLNTIPTAAERTGDFSQAVDSAGNPLIVYDPSTTRPNPNYDPTQPVSTGNLQYLRDPFPGNVIPGYRLDPTATQALSYYPLPNTAVGPFFQNNYFTTSPETNIANGVIGKMDHTIDEHVRLTTELQDSNGFLGAAKLIPNLANPGTQNRNFNTRRGSVGYTWTISPSTVNSGSFQATSNSSRSGDGETNPFPIYRFGSWLGMGTEYPVSTNARNTYEWHDNLSIRAGKHALQLGGQYFKYQVNSFWPQDPSGYYTFDSGLTSLPGIVDTGDPFASFLLGLPSWAQRTVDLAPSYFRNSVASLSATDRYEFRKDLTLSFGLTLNRHTARVEKYGRQSTIDLQAIDPSNNRPGALVAAGQDGLSQGFRPTIFSLDTSAGVAWNPAGDSKSVVRLNFWRSHSAIPIYSGQWGTQGFIGIQTFLSPNTQLQPALPLTGGFPPLPYPLPNLSPDAADNTNATLTDISGREPLSQAAGVSFERELPYSLVVTAGASYQGGRDQLTGSWAVNPNALPVSALQFGNDLYDQAFNAALRPYPQFTGFDLSSLYPTGRYQRNSTYFKLEKRASNGLTLTAYYEYSHEMDDYSGPYGNQDLTNLSNDWSPTSWNQPQRLTVSYSWDLPFGPNKALLHFSDWRRQLVDGWSVSGTCYMDDGTPLALHPEFNNTGGVLSTLNVNVVPGVNPASPDQGPNEWFNPAAFAQPGDFTMGNGPRTTLAVLNPGTTNLDVSLLKRTTLGNERALEFTASAFDFLNHADWNQPDTMIGPASAPNLDAGRIIGSHGGRVIQLGLTVSF